ncbi:MAG: leucine-rich repeat protein, partial [Acholeplasmataceae bacterium]|nr:leucine-rich repeat protein [Acholeplasmataceae bacterium]
MLKKIRLLLVLFLAIMLFGCDGSTGMTVKFHIEGENNVVTVKAKKGEIVMPNDPYIDGFIFDGWYLDDGTFMVEFEPEMLKEMLSSSVVDVYAKWRDTITIIFRAEGAEDIIITLKIGTSPEELPDVPEKTGFFGYWDAVDYSQLRGDTVVQAVYTDASDLKHHINFYCGDTQKQLLVSHGDRVFQYPTFEIDEDYFIEGWYFDEDFTQPFNNEQPINDNLTLYGNISSFYTTEPLGEDLIITGYLGSKSNLVIPEKIFDKVVSGIADSAFADVDFLKTVTIPFTVTTIGEEAFANSSIQEITLPDTLTEIGKSAFAGCTGLTELSIPGSNIQFGVDILTGCTNLESLAVPFGNQLTFLGYLFGAASAAENDLVPESLQSVEARADAISLAAAAFINCTSLTSLRLHGFTSIGEAAFYGCTNIKELELPASLNEIALGALSGLNNLESLTLSFIGETSSKNTYLGHLFGATVASENVNFIPEGLQTITLSYTKTIPENAFLNCSSLVNINLSDGLEEIGAHAFSGCSGLKEINLPSSLISIGFAAFEDCSNLETLVLPFIGETDKTNNYLGHLFGAASALENAQYIPQTLRKVEIYHVTALPSRALYNCSMLEEIILPDDLESIGEEAFALCNGLVSIELASPLKTIQNRAFADCLGLKEAFIPDSVQSIGFAIFEGCDNLENLRVPFLGENFEAFAHLGYFFGAPTYEDNATYVPASLEELVVSDKCYGFGTNAFYECNNLRTVTMFASGIFLDSELMLVFAYDMAGHEAYPWTVPTYPLEAISKLRFWEGFAYFVENNQVRIIRGNNQEVANIPETIEGYPVKTIGYYTFANQKVKTVSLPENLDVIEDYAFYNCTDLEVISLPERLDSIGKSAFAYCEALESITLPDNLTIISESLFRHCSELQNVVLPQYLEKISIYAFTECTSITDLSLSTSVYLIEGYAFDNSGINSIVIPNSEAYIEYNAFVNCDNLESITLHWKDNRDFSAIFDERANTVLKEITILEGCVAIKNREFSGYTALERITLPDTVTSIGYSAFNGCTKLANIRLPKNLTIIDENTFFNCSSLEEITLPEKLTDINYGAFRNCTRLMHIDFPATLTQIIDRAFEGCSSLAEVYLPLNITFIGQDAFNTGVNTLFLCAAPELPERWNQNWAGLSQNIHWNIDYEQIGRFEKMLYLIEGNAVTILSVDQDVVELIIPEQIAGFPVTKIRSWAIKYCENLRKLVIPDTTLTIEAGAIVATRGIQSLTLPFLGGSRSDNEPLSYIFYGN